MPKYAFFVWLLVAALSIGFLSASASPPPASAHSPSTTTATNLPEVTQITVDGVVDAAYGPPIASDPAGDHWAGNANLDLLDLYVADDPSNFYVAFTINDDITATDWGKYALYLDTTNDANGATSDAWTRNVIVDDPHKPEFGLYTWVDAPPYGPDHTQLVAWTGSDWDWPNVKPASAAALASTGVTSTIEYQIAKADLGNPDSLWVEVWDTGGGGSDNAQDTINDPADDWNATDWATQAVLACSTPFTATTPSQPPSHDDNVWWDGLEHDSRSDLYRQPFGAVVTSTTLSLRFRTYANDVTGVQVRLWDTAMESQTIYPMSHLSTIPGDPYDYDVWELQFDAPDYLTVLYYRFLVTDGSDTDYYEDDDLFDGGLGQPYDDSPDNSWQIDVYHPDFDTPDWFKDAVVYQVFPDRFRNGLADNDPISGTFFYDEDPGTLTAPQWNWIVPDPRVPGPWENSYSKLFYGGDLQGIIDKLDYLQAQGVTTLYLNPIFESPSNHKYDTTNYEEVDDNFGDLATYITLTNELESRGMHLVLDGVFNHTSSDSHYFDRYDRYPGFVGACEDLNSPYRDWYYFSPADPPGSGVCAGDTNYQAWWGFDSLPKLNTTDNPGVRSYIYSDTLAIATYWLEQGADGWRLDVAGDVHPSFWQDWRAYIRNANPNAITIAEEWGDASHFILGDELDSSMNYRFRNAVIGLLRGAEWPTTDWQDTNAHIQSLSVSQFDSLMHSIQEDYPPEAFYAMMNLVGSHDTNRVLLPLSLQDTDADPTATDFAAGKDRLRALAIVQMTMPGAPTVYYGDEVGLVGYGDDAGGGVYYADPYNRQPYPWPDEPGYGSLPAWRQQDLSLHAHYSATANIRNAHPALRTGSFDSLLVDDEAETYAYGRKLGADAAVVALNLGATQTLTVPLNGYLPDGTALSDELNGDAPYTVSGGQIVLSDVPHLWGAILTVDAGQDLIPPDPPTNLTAVEGDGAVYLDWTAPVSPTAAYNVYRSYVPGGGYTRIATGTVGTAYTDTNVTNSQWYYYVVAALDASGNESDLSNQAAALPHADIDWAGELEPASLTHTIGLTPTQPISAQVWVSGVTDLPGQGTGVLAELGLGLSGTLSSTWPVWVPLDYVNDVGNNDQYATSLTPEMTGTLHYLARFSTTGGREWTYARTAGGQMGVLTVLPSADVTPPATPLNLRLQDWAAGWLELAWDPVSGDPSLYAYDLFRSEVSGTVGSHVARVLAPSAVYTDTSVSTGQTYYYRVQAVDTSFNRSGYSNQVEATPEAKMVAVSFQATVPDYTPEDATVYVVGDIPELCGWCNPQTVALTQTGAITWSRVISLADGQAIQYKYTRGNWNVNEWWGPIYSVYNREATVDYGDDGSQVLADVVHYWRDPLVISHYPAVDATGVDPSPVISATLSRYLDATTIVSDNLVLYSAVETPTLEVGFFYHVDMTATTILLTPTTPLAEGDRYTVSLETGLTGRQDDNEGVSLQREYVWGFRVAGPSLSIDKSVEPTLDVPLGGVVTYTVVLSNIGDAPANGAVMTDRLPLGIGFGGWLDQGSALLPEPPGHTITWGPYSVPAGDGFTFRFTATVTTSTTYYGQAITNVAHYRHASGAGSDQATFVIQAEPPPPAPNLAITKTVDAAHDPAQLGDPITYTIVLINTGLGDADGVVVSDVLPLGVIGNDLSWTGTVSASDQVSFILPASVTTDTMYYGQSLTNTAYYNHASGSGSGEATFTIQAEPPPPEPILSILKSVDAAHDPAQLGAPILYTVTVINVGLADATGVVVSDVLPLGVIGNDLNWTGTVSASDQVSLVVAASVTTDTMYYGQTITNTAHYSHTSGRGSAVASFTIQSEPFVEHIIYLPVVLRGWSPLPYQPTLDPIQGVEDGDYEISWQELPSRQADTYILQEALDANFTVELRQVCTTAQTSCAVTDQPPGTYYYRVRGENAYGVGFWSETQTAFVPGIQDQVTDISLTLPQPLGGMVSSLCTWGGCSLSPRLYHEPLPDDRTLIGWTDASGNGHVSVVSASGNLEQTYNFTARSLRGLVAHDDGSFAILLWDPGAEIMWLSKRNPTGGEIWTTNIDGSMTSFNPNIGDSRLAYGNGIYAAYFAVHGDSGWPAGHEGDQLTYVSDTGAIQPGGWEWGCSHSMADLVSYHPTFDKFAPTCSSDCYASKGILLNDSQVVYASDGNCGGRVSAQLGQIALSNDAWKLVFNAMERPGYVGRGIGLATVDSDFQSTYVWLTNTDGQYERDPVLARLGSSLQSNQYLVGWRTTDDGQYWLGLIDGNGNFLDGPEKVTPAGIAWGNRDDSFRTRADGSVSWVRGQPDSSTLHLFRFEASGSLSAIHSTP